MRIEIPVSRSVRPEFLVARIAGTAELRRRADTATGARSVAQRVDLLPRLRAYDPVDGHARRLLERAYA